MATPAVRYSQGQKDIGEARNFPWEHAVPDTRFWRDIPFTAARNFLQNFSLDEENHLSINPDTDLSHQAKLELLERLLRERLATKEADVAPQTLHETDYPAWERLYLAIVTMQKELGRAAEAEQTLRMMIENRRDKTNLSFLHSLASMLLARGEYAEAERMEREVVGWLDGRLGRGSPQALNARRIVAEAVWKQGRRGEAEVVLKEVEGILGEDGEMGMGGYAVYREGEVEATEKLRRELVGVGEGEDDVGQAEV
ncbi:hypothetical protein B0T19DRAFT_115559 [Cercophora scortea]|uniref:TPR-like protein n=1 Tax=Cercophora scortea TaxID=314031 RepID=A0AAE0IY40_9PEZI|nr:hypothetical protein B0T19DRAFT_115559 [Cercophora scortea]